MGEPIEAGTAVVVDVGSGFCKAGAAGEDAPRCVFSAVIGRVKHGSKKKPVGTAYSMVGRPEGNNPDKNEEGGDMIFVGEQAIEKRGMLSISYPMEHGIVTNWGDMEKIWRHMFFVELKIDPSEHPVLLTEAPLNPRRNREEMARRMFETFSVPMLYVSIQAVLSLYASGRTTGVVMDCGDGLTHTVPIFEGFSIPHAMLRVDLGGRDLTTFLMRIFMERGEFFTTSAHLETVRQLKEKLCYISLDYEVEKEKFTYIDDHPDSFEEHEELKGMLKEYEMPDGRVIHVGSEQIECPEVLFDPTLMGRHEMQGVHETTFESIKMCGRDLTVHLLQNVVLSGGTTMLGNFAARMTAELIELAPKGLAVKVHATPERKYSVWIGGAILSSLASFESMWITAEKYAEEGNAAVHDAAMASR
jgi:actin-related protein